MSIFVVPIKKSLRTISQSLILLIALSMSGVSAKDLDVTIVTEILPPYQFKNEAGELDGYSVEVMRALLKEAKLDEEIQLFPWSRSYKIANTQPNVIIFSLARTEERLKNFHWIGEIHSETYIFLKLSENKDLVVNDLDDLKDLSILVPRDSVGDQLLTGLGFTNITRTNGLVQSIQMLQSNRTDLILASDYALKHSITPRGMKRLPQEVIYELKDYSSGIFIAVSQRSDPELIDNLKRAFQTLEQNGTIDQLKKKWDM